MDSIVNFIKNTSIKQGLDAQNLDIEVSNQVDSSVKVANQIDVHQVASRSELAEMERNVSRSDGHIGEENHYSIL